MNARLAPSTALGRGSVHWMPETGFELALASLLGITLPPGAVDRVSQVAVA